MPLPLRLSPVQRRLLTLTRQRGPFAVVAIITAFSVAMSLVVTGLTVVLLPTTPEFVVISLIVAAAVPLAVAPLCSTLVVRLLTSLAAAYEQVHVLASTDALTGLASRRHFFDVAGALVAEGGPNDVLVVAMIDVDRFKALNDTFGHAAGDDALVLLADRLRRAVGPRGVAGRVGGDEFAVVVPVTDGGDLRHVTEAVHRACTAIALPSGVTIDASVGLRCVDAPTEIDETMRLADAALYEAKAGRRPPARVEPV
jgi:diguanylate cyclase (GGDEF)-like protein